MRLWSYLSLLLNSILVAVFLFYGAYSAVTRSESYAATLRDDARMTARIIGAAAVNDIIAGNLDNLESLLMRVAGNVRISELAIGAPSGQILSRIERGADQKVRPVYSATPQSIQRMIEASGTAEEFRHLVPVERGGVIGWVAVVSSLAELSALRRSIWLESIALAMGASVFSSLLLLFMVRRLTRSLEAAAEFSHRLIERPGLTMPVNDRVGELNRLKVALNQTSQLLQQQFRHLQDDEARKRATFEGALDCFIVTDEDNRIQDMNQAAEATFGYSREEALGARMSDLIVPPSQRGAHANGMRHYLEAGISPVVRKRIDLKAMRADGTELPVEVSIVPFMSDGKQHFFSSLRDISSRRELEIKQKRTRYLLKRMVADLQARQLAIDQHAIVSITDLRGNMIYANEKFIETTQYSRAELIGKTHRMLKSGVHDNAFYEQMWGTITGGQVWNGELANRRKDGTICWVATTIVPMLNVDGQAARYIAIRTDITQQKEVQRKLARNQHDLERMIVQYRATEVELAEARAQELSIGSAIQHTLLFGEIPPEQDRLEMAVHTEASQGIDGDFYDFFSFGPDCFDVSIGDVMGKGVPAALLGAAFKKQQMRCLASALAAATEPGQLPRPADLINSLHAMITPRLIALESFVTLSYLRFDLASNIVTMVDAGHTPLIHIGSHGLRLVSGHNTALGVIESEVYEQRSLQLLSGDLLFLFSDGVTDARSKDGDGFFGLERLGALLQALYPAGLPATIVLQAVRHALHEFEQLARPGDDRTCMVIQVDDSASRQQRLPGFELPWTLAGLAPLRQHIHAAAAGSVISDEATAALALAAFEAATNIVRHVPKPLEDATIHCRIERTSRGLSVELHHLGKAFVPLNTKPEFSIDNDGGLGLYIIRNSVSAVHYDSPADGVCRIRLEQHFTLEHAQ